MKSKDKKLPKPQKVYVVGTHQYCFRAGEPAQIIGVKMGELYEKSEPRLLYEVKYADGVRDLVCVSEIGTNFKLLTFNEVKEQV